MTEKFTFSNVSGRAAQFTATNGLFERSEFSCIYDASNSFPVPCIELSFLKTLPSRELKAGYIELLKHGFIHDEELLDFVRSNSLEPLDFDFLEEAILRSCTIKGRIVEKDETETGIRATLNFGHTLGHLIEIHAGYGKYLHGEAYQSNLYSISRKKST